MDKKLHGTQDVDMRQTLACVCQNDIGEAVRPFKNIKKPPRDHSFRNSKKNNPKDAENLPKGHPTEVKTDPQTTKRPTQNHIEKWSGEKPVAGSRPGRGWGTGRKLAQTPRGVRGVPPGEVKCLL